MTRTLPFSSAFLALLVPAASVASPTPRHESVRADTVLTVTDVRFGPAHLGSNDFQATVRNVGDEPVMALLDLRAVPGMWMIPNMQRQFPVELAPGETEVMRGTYEFRRLSEEATLRIRIGPGERTKEGALVLTSVDFDHTAPVGKDSPDAYHPDRYFTITERGPFEIYTWKGSLAERRVDALASERLRALGELERLLDVAGPSRIRLVFYPDEPTKIEQTGHHGVGWAFGTTLVEVYNEQTQLDPYHELAHIVAAEVGSPPPALDEGFAVYASERLGADALRFLGYAGQSVDSVVCSVAGTDDFIPLEDLLALGNIGSTKERSGREYAESGSFVKFLVETLGSERFRKAYATLRAGAAPEDDVAELREIYGTGLSELSQKWLAHACGGG